MKKVEMKDGKLVVPNHIEIPYIIGDGIGADIWRAAERVFLAAVEKCYGDAKSIEWTEVLAGEKAFEQRGEWLPIETLETIKEHLIAIKGPLTTPIGGGIRSLNVALRQELDLFACVRPIRYFQGVPSPVKHPENVELVIFRENTEDIYAGIEYKAFSSEANKIIQFLREEMGAKSIRFPESSGIGIKPVSKEGSERLIRSSIKYAMEQHLPSVTLVHKGNIMKFTEGAFKQWGYDLAENEFPEEVFTMQQYEMIKKEKSEEAAFLALNEAKDKEKIIVKDIIADIFLQKVLINPEDFSVVATLNLNGDYASDALAAQVGGIGISPGANINYQTGHAIFEATHGTAPIFANQNKANPSSIILSGCMMFDYIGWHEASTLIQSALEKTILSKRVTFDFADYIDAADCLTTSEFGEEIIRNFI